MSNPPDQPPLPLLFTIPPSSRHELLLLPTPASLTLKSLNQQILAAISASPNCAEFMGKYKSSGSGGDQEGGEEGGGSSKEQILEMKVRWSMECGRDRKAWPERTVVTEGNLRAVVEMLAGVGRGRDVLEVRVGRE